MRVGWTQAPPAIQGQLLFRYPVQAGTSYQYADTANTDRTFQVTVARDSVSVPDGTYHCLIYDVHEADSAVVEAAIKPGVGPVRVSLDGGETVLELTSSTVEN